MAQAVGNAIRQQRHLVVQAGTGTGKSLAYLVPALVFGTRVVVSTATKALQDQLALRDLPRLRYSLGLRFEFAVLKGRSNYICRQRLSELFSGADQMMLGEDGPTGPAGGGRSVGPAAGPGGPAGQLGQLGREIRRLLEWVRDGGEKLSGDRAELPFEPSDSAWAQVSTSWRECPGAGRCPEGERCFAELARRRAGQADVVVVNTHLYATSLAIGEADVLPEHDLVVFDEAHELEDIISGAFGFDLGQARVSALARMARSMVADPSVAGALEDSASMLLGALRPFRDQALPVPLEENIARALGLLRERANRLLEQLRQANRAGSGAAPGALGGPRGPGGAGGADSGEQARRLRAQKAATHLVEDVNQILELPPTQIAWVEGPEHAPLLKVAPIDVGQSMVERFWRKEGAPTAILASATIPPRLGERLGLAPGSYDELDVGSPFAYEDQALLYCPLHLPDPRSPQFEAAMHDELCALIEASEGRALALFTSWRAMTAAAEVARRRLPWAVLTQSDLPKPKLVEKFSTEEHSCLFATMGFWQGVDVPGTSLSLVTIDRLPFARPDDPLLRARRDALGPRAFELIDVPRAATLLAQGVGRLVRSSQDRGVVAVLDPRLGKARYRWDLVRALPPMRRTRNRADVVDFLASLRSKKGA